MPLRRRHLALALLFALAGGLGWGAWILGRGGEPRGVRATVSIAEALSRSDGAGFARAESPRAFSFPRDHGPHPEYRIEWWYYTGTLVASGGRRLGFQLTFFRSGLVPKTPARSSAWATREVWMAHFALTDVARRRFHAFERLSRGALGLAGARPEPFRVWVEDWSAEGAGSGDLPMRLRARDGAFAIDLTLTSERPPVLHGERGLSRKGEEPGNASYYYSLTRMVTRGIVAVGGEHLEVSGLGWMDREWSTSTLGSDLAGWDWFALHLSDGRDLMVYRLRRHDGSAGPFSMGTLVAADGASRGLARDAVQITTLERWQSDRSGHRYPSRWRLRVPGEGLDLEIVPRLPDQELDLTVRYWEGAVTARGTSRGAPLRGDGYVELVGYGDRP